jgi:hypothetical protein
METDRFPGSTIVHDEILWARTRPSIASHPNPWEDVNAASTSVVSADIRFQGSNGATGRAGSAQRIRYRKFGINWRVSDTAKAKSAKSTSSLYLGFNYDPNKAAAVFIFAR